MDSKLAFQPPIIIDPTQRNEFASQNTILESVDIYDSQVIELNRINNPANDPNVVNAKPQETLVYFPWNKTLLRTVGEDSLQTLRTNRNKNLITDTQQDLLANSTIGIAGMSVGAGIALSLAYSGISNHIKIADHDVLDTSNLNRLRESLLSVGRPKVELAAQHIYELNPFANVELFTSGVTANSIDKFFNDPKLAVVVDEIDDFKMKIQLRLKAREYQIPLVMFTSLGDNILVDIERYDLDPNLELFHGILQGVGEDILANPNIDAADIRRYSVQLVGQQYIPTSALASVAEMGRTLVGRPQLYSTIAVDGGLAAFLIRTLLLTGNPKSGRYFIEFNKLFELQNTELEQSNTRNQILERLFSNG